MQLLFGHGMAGSLMQKVQARTQVLTPSTLHAQTIRHNGLLVLHLGSSKPTQTAPTGMGFGGVGSGVRMQFAALIRTTDEFVAACVRPRLASLRCLQHQL